MPSEIDKYLSRYETPSYLQSTTSPPTPPQPAAPTDEPGYIETGLTSVARGGTGIISGAGAAVQWLGDVTGADVIQEAGTGLRGVAEKVQQSGVLDLEGETFRGTFMENPSLKRAFGIVGEAVPSLALGMGTGGIAALGLRGAGVLAPTAARIGTGIAAGELGLIEGAPQYLEAKEAGKGLGEASAIGAAATVGTAALEFLGLGRLFGLAGKGAIKGAGKGFISEGAQEGTQQLWQNIVAKVGYDESRSLVDGMAEAIIGGSGAGGIAGGISGGMLKRASVQEDQVAEQTLAKVIPNSQVVVENGMATVVQTTATGETTITAPVENIAKALASNVTPEELAAASAVMQFGVESVRDEVLTEAAAEQKTQAERFLRLPKDITQPDVFSYEIDEVRYDYSVPEGMTRQEVDTQLEGKSPIMQVNILKGLNARVIKQEKVAETEAPSTTEVVAEPATTEEVITPTEPEIVAPKKRTLAKEDTLGGLSTAEVVSLVAAGDVKAVAHVREGIKEHGVAAVEDAVLNKLNVPIAEAKTKEERQQITETIEPIQTEIKEVFKTQHEADVIQKRATEIDPSLTFDREHEGLYYFTPTEGPSKTATFTVKEPTKEVISDALKKSQQKFIKAEERKLETETPTAPEAAKEEAEAQRIPFTKEQLDTVAIDVQTQVEGQTEPLTIQRSATEVLVEVEQKSERHKKLLDCLVT